MRSSADRWPRTLTVAIVLLSVVLAGLTFRRLFFGVDFVDESWYLACPYRFVLGDTPFVDEMNPSQTAFLTTLPLLRLYAWITGGIDGAILYMRILYFALCCVVTGCAWLCFRRLIGGAPALLAALICVLFVPGGLPTLSYNTLASGFFSAGIFLGFASSGTRRQDLGLFAAGVAHGLSTLAIPSYSVPCLVFFLLMFRFRLKSGRLRAAVLYGCGGIVPVLLLSPWLRHLNSEFVQAAYRYAEGGTGWLGKVKRILRMGWLVLPRKALLGASLLLFVFALRKRTRSLALIPLCALPMVLMKSRDISSSLFYVMLLASCGPLLLWFLREKERIRELFLVVWLPSAVCGVIAPLSSASGLAMSAFGLLPAAVLTSVLAVLVVRELVPWKVPWTVAAISLIWPFTVALGLLRFQQYCFRDEIVSRLDSRMESGPFRGLHTSPAKREFWERISADAASFSDPARRILFLPILPAGYLATRMRPAGKTVYGPWPPRKTEQALRGDLRIVEGEGIVVFEMRWSDIGPALPPFRPTRPAGAPLPRGFRLVLERPEYSVFLFP